MAGWLAS
jgi:hypothetical protein